MRLTLFPAASLLLVGSASLAEASHSERAHHRVVRSPGNVNPVHSSLAARSVDASVHKNDPRTLCLLNGILGGTFDKFCQNKKPSCYWKCSGSGLDGYDYDCNGNTLPGHYPAGWKWFGQDKGWGPPKNYWCNDDQELPWEFLNKCNLFTWWSVSISWKKCPINWNPPSWWPPVKPPTTTTTQQPPTTTSQPPKPSQSQPSCHAPPKDWQSCGDGKDGWDVDYDCKPCPYSGDNLFDSNGKWKFFGSKYGWQPEESWNIPYDDWKPPQGWDDKECAKATWWVPGSFWKYPSWWVVPSFWKTLDPSWCSYLDDKCGKPDTTSCPAKDWQSCGDGKDGWDLDYDCKPCPYSGDNLFDSNGKWKFFGSKYGWQPEESWNIPYPEWAPPQGWTDVECAKATWWVPGSFWQYPSWWKVPSFWKQLDPSWCSYLDKTCGNDGGDNNNGGDHPDPDWDCDGSGEDGHDHDDQGNGCPWGNIGWKWFGKNHGWLPPKGWVCNDDWQPIDCDYSKASWWCPPSTWRCPIWFKLPSLWKIKFNFHPINWPQPGWNCNGSGNDGWDFDHEGNTKPDWCPSGWKWYGVNFGWHPVKGWGLPSKNWTPPKQWQPKLCRWWAPNINWSLPSGFWCPIWWPKSLLLGNLLNFF
ncbi:hypothetical protein OIV83_004369 [Microbotryomycetes sp. JL201]|nr:hypothetical protein OIV83_004369 [Microbotryomycetes sp. JL201]